MKIIECTKSYEAVSGHGGLLINMSIQTRHSSLRIPKWTVALMQR